MKRSQLTALVDMPDNLLLEDASQESINGRRSVVWESLLRLDPAPVIPICSCSQAIAGTSI